jgi:hypothetical protein
MATANRRAKQPARRPAPGNRREPLRTRRVKAAARTASYQPRARTLALPRLDAAFWWNTARALAGLALVPAALVTAQTFFDTFADSAIGAGAWRTPGFWFFCLGMGIWVIAFFTLPRPMGLYVLGHELTHAFFIFLSGGKVQKFEVTRRGGFVVTDKNNLLITLSPYFFPFYSLVVFLAFALVGSQFDLTALHAGAIYGIADFKPIWGVYALVGLTWGFHLTFTLWMLTKDQPDLREYGVLFSLVFIVLVNLAVISAGLVTVSPDATLSGFLDQWANHARDLGRSATGLARAAF